MPAGRRDADPASQRDGGSKPLQRGRAGSTSGAAASTDGPSRIRDVRDSARDTRRPPRPALKPKGDGARHGPGETRPARGRTAVLRDAASPIAGGEAAPKGDSDSRRVML